MDADRHRRVSDLFAAALERPAHERAAFLLEAADDEHIRAEVESLLEHDSADDFLEPLFGPPVSSMPFAGGAVEPATRTGQTLGTYRIGRRLGEGGMGVVYLADDLSRGRPVALKFLHPDLAIDRHAATRLLREGRAGAALDHPHVCGVLAVDSTESGEPFLALEYYEGETLKARLGRGAVPLAEALRIARQIAAGLAAAHAAGIVHRDVKPGNILLTPSGVRILDFGIAQVADLTSLTQRGLRLGTADYASPEQLAGAAVDHRTDIWSLAVVLHEMLEGRRPFPARRSSTPALGDEGLPPLKGRAVPEALQTLLTRAARIDPAARLSTMRDFEQKIAAIERAEALDHHGPPPANGSADLDAALNALDEADDKTRERIIADERWPVGATDDRARAMGARIRYFAGHYERARQEFAALSAADPSSAVRAFDEAVGLAKLGVVREAMDACDRALLGTDGRAILAAVLALGAPKAPLTAAREIIASADARIAEGCRALLDVQFGSLGRPLEYFEADRRAPDLRGYLGLRSLPGTLAAFVAPLGLVVYLGVDSALDCLRAAPLAMRLARQLDLSDADLNVPR